MIRKIKRRYNFMGSNVKYLTKDIQSQTEGFAKLPIKKVGVRGMVAPIKILRKDNNEWKHYIPKENHDLVEKYFKELEYKKRNNGNNKDNS